MDLILGLDIATHDSGVALLDQDGNLIDHKLISSWQTNFIDRCKYIYDQLELFIKDHPEIKYVGLEDTLLNKFVPNLNSCKSLIILSGWIMALCHKYNLQVDIMTANNWKSSIGIMTGPEGRTRNAQKQRAVRLVENKFGIKVDDNQADAICIALCEVNKYKKNP